MLMEYKDGFLIVKKTCIAFSALPYKLTDVILNAICAIASDTIAIYNAV